MFYTVLSVLVLGFIIYNVMNAFSFRELLNSFGFLKMTRRDFYECGFSPTKQKTMSLPMQFLLMCVFFLLYDIELIFLFPYVSGLDFVGLYEVLIMLLFFLMLFFSLMVDFNSHALTWQY